MPRAAAPVHWPAAEKIPYSRTLVEPRTVRTQLEREFDPAIARRLKGEARQDITVNGTGARRARVKGWSADELQMFLCPAVVGAGNGSSRIVCG